MEFLNDLPIGLEMALAQNLEAMNRFNALSPKEQQAVIQGARQVQSKKEMQAYVGALASAGKTHSFFE